MTYGPDLKWPFNGRLDIRKGGRKSLVVVGCFVAFFILSTYFYFTNTTPFRNTPSTSSRGFANSFIDKGRLIKDVFETSPNRTRSTYKDEASAKFVITKTKVVISAKDKNLVTTKAVNDEKEALVDTKVDLNESVLLKPDSEDIDDYYKKEFLTESVILNPELLSEKSLEPESEYFINDNDLYASTNSKQGGIDWNDPRLDILHMPKPEFSPQFQNPCWYEPLSGPHPYKHNLYTTYSSSAKQVLAKLTKRWEELYEEEKEPRRLRCLPYFLIIGQPKCGSTDLFWKIAKHPDIDTPPIKELHWWSRNRQGRQFSYEKIIPFEDYVDMFDKAAIQIEEKVSNMSVLGRDTLQKDAPPTSQIITGEASVSVLWDNYDWWKFPENAQKEEPAYVIPNYVHHIIPDVKLIVILREPVERMYSDYLYFHSSNKSADAFHQAVVTAIQYYQNCTHQHSMRYCAYSARVSNKAKIRLKVGLYSVFLKDWLNIFPREQFHVLRLEDYSKDPISHIKQIYRFLNVREITVEEEALILDSPTSNVRKPEDQELGGMHEETRVLLEEFYRPFNVELATLLQDKKFLWQDKL